MNDRKAYRSGPVSSGTHPAAPAPHASTARAILGCRVRVSSQPRSGFSCWVESGNTDRRDRLRRPARNGHHNRVHVVSASKFEVPIRTVRLVAVLKTTRARQTKSARDAIVESNQERSEAEQAWNGVSEAIQEKKRRAEQEERNIEWLNCCNNFHTAVSRSRSF